MTVEQLRAELAAAIKQGYYDAVALGSFDERGFWQSLDGPETAADRVVESEPIRALLELRRRASRAVDFDPEVYSGPDDKTMAELRAAVAVVDGYLTPETPEFTRLSSTPERPTQTTTNTPTRIDSTEPLVAGAASNDQETP